MRICTLMGVMVECNGVHKVGLLKLISPVTNIHMYYSTYVINITLKQNYVFILVRMHI